MSETFEQTAKKGRGGRRSSQPFDYFAVPCRTCRALIGEVCVRPGRVRAYHPHSARRKAAMTYREPTSDYVLLAPDLLRIDFDWGARPTREALDKVASRAVATLFPAERLSASWIEDRPAILEYASGQECAVLYRIAKRGRR